MSERPDRATPRDQLTGPYRAVSDVLDDYLMREYGRITSHNGWDLFLDLLAERGHEVREKARPDEVHEQQCEDCGQHVAIVLADHDEAGHYTCAMSGRPAKPVTPPGTVTPTVACGTCTRVVDLVVDHHDHLPADGGPGSELPPDHCGGSGVEALHYATSTTPHEPRLREALGHVAWWCHGIAAKAKAQGNFPLEATAPRIAEEIGRALAGEPLAYADPTRSPETDEVMAWLREHGQTT